MRHVLNIELDETSPLFGDVRVAMACLATPGPLSPEVFAAFSDEVKDNDSLALMACMKAPTVLRFLNPRFLDDEILVMTALQSRPTLYSVISDRLKDSESVLSAVAHEYPYLYRYASPRLRSIARIASMYSDSGCLEALSADLRNNKNIVISYLHTGIPSIAYAGVDMRDDEDVVKVALINHPNEMRYASERLKGDSDFVWKIYLDRIDVRCLSYRYLSKKIRGDIDLARCVVSCKPENFRFCTKEVRGDLALIQVTAHKMPRMIKHAYTNSLSKETLYDLWFRTATHADGSFKVLPRKALKDDDFCAYVIRNGPSLFGQFYRLAISNSHIPNTYVVNYAIDQYPHNIKHLESPSTAHVRRAIRSASSQRISIRETMAFLLTKSTNPRVRVMIVKHYGALSLLRCRLVDNIKFHVLCALRCSEFDDLSMARIMGTYIQFKRDDTAMVEGMCPQSLNLLEDLDSFLAAEPCDVGPVPTALWTRIMDSRKRIKENYPEEQLPDKKRLTTYIGDGDYEYNVSN